MLGKALKRFYKDAQATAVEAGGFAIHLDGKAVKTPLGRPLRLPNARLAEAVAAEWRAQGGTILPHTMPLTQLASTALDRTGPERASISEQLMGYAATDLLCYRADFPPELAERQARGWQPWLDWARDEVGARLVVTAGILAIDQPAEALAALAARIESLDDWRLAGVQSACPALGSLVLALALEAGRLSASDAFALSHLDETFQAEQWGEDTEAAARRTALEADVMAAERWLGLLSSNGRG